MHSAMDIHAMSFRVNYLYPVVPPWVWISTDLHAQKRDPTAAENLGILRLLLETLTDMLHTKNTRQDAQIVRSRSAPRLLPGRAGLSTVTGVLGIIRTMTTAPSRIDARDTTGPLIGSDMEATAPSRIDARDTTGPLIGSDMEATAPSRIDARDTTGPLIVAGCVMKITTPSSPYANKVWGLIHIRDSMIP